MGKGDRSSTPLQAHFSQPMIDRRAGLEVMRVGELVLPFTASGTHENGPYPLPGHSRADPGDREVDVPAGEHMERYPYILPAVVIGETTWDSARDLTLVREAQNRTTGRLTHAATS